MCYFSGDFTSVVAFCIPSSVSFRFALLVSGDPVSSDGFQADIRIALSTRTECALLNWVPVNNCLFSIRLNDFVGINISRLESRCPFFI